jgi:uncharacterized protein (DUF488 family)
MKRWLEDISVELGGDGEITPEILLEGEKRLALRSGKDYNSGVNPGEKRARPDGRPNLVPRK